MSAAVVAVGDVRRGIALPDASVDAVVCDPPYELAFMGRAWDASGVAYDVDVWRDVLRVLKPGGHLLAFGGTRTYHRMTCAIEDAGFEIRDSVHWIYGTGFPKSLDVSKAIGKRRAEAARWTGFGTALKPAHEPIVVARKPLVGTVAANVTTYGTGALNIDACRVATDWSERSDAWKRSGHSADPDAEKIAAPPGVGITCHDAGRWPPNVIFAHAGACTDDACDAACPVAELASQSGTSTSRATDAPRGRRNGGFGDVGADRGTNVPNGAQHNDTGTATRFFPVFRYVAKASTREREAGCEALPSMSGAEMVDRTEGSAGTQSPRAGAGRTASERRNTHPTVKPVALMRWLVRLVTPPGGVVLDPFTGSGTTGVAAVLEGFDFLGVELDPAHADIARARIAHAQRETR
jgi:site-specific DNA-methyltransferase (adenine-specific)